MTDEEYVKQIKHNIKFGKFGFIDKLTKQINKNMKQQIEGYYIKSKEDKVIQEEDNIIVFNLIKSPNGVYNDRKILRLILKYFYSGMSKSEQEITKELMALLKAYNNN